MDIFKTLSKIDIVQSIPMERGERTCLNPNCEGEKKADYSSCFCKNKKLQRVEKLARLVAVKASIPCQPQADRLLLFNGFMPSN